MIQEPDQLVHEIEGALSRLSEEQRKEVMLFIEFLEYQSRTPSSTAVNSDEIPTERAVQPTLAESAPIYHIHENAIDTGIADLADQHDHYLYGTSKHDA